MTDYEEDDIYVNNVLYQTSHDEGRIANGVYEYNITDHNNDLRVAFRDSSGIAVPTQSIFYHAHPDLQSGWFGFATVSQLPKTTPACPKLYFMADLRCVKEQ